MMKTSNGWNSIYANSLLLGTVAIVVAACGSYDEMQASAPATSDNADLTAQAWPTCNILGPNPICGASTANYSVDYVASKYQWQFSGSCGTGDATHQNVTIGTDGGPTCNMAVWAGWANGATCSRTITTNPPVVPHFNNPPYRVCQYSSTNLEIAAVSNVGPYIWRYTGPTNGIKLAGGGTTMSVIANRVGSYAIYAKTSNACGASPEAVTYLDVVACGP